MPLPGLGTPVIHRIAAGGFTPPTLMGSTSWFRADLGRTTSGSQVTQMADQSGAMLIPTLTRVSGGTGPTFLASGINSRPDLLWTGGLSTVLMNPSTTAMLGTSGITLFAILQTTNTASGRIWGMQYNYYHYLLAVNYSGGLGDGIGSYVTADNTEARSNSPINDGNPHVLIGTWSTSDDTARLYVDGVMAAVITGASSTMPSPGGGDVNAWGDGSDGTNTFQGFTGQCPEVGSYNRALTGSDLSALYSYLAANAGI